MAQYPQFVFDVNGTYTALSFGQAVKYDNAWRKYVEVQNYNSNVSTIWGNGNKNVKPYPFSGAQERNLFNQGQALFQQAYPGSNTNLIRPQ